MCECMMMQKCCVSHQLLLSHSHHQRWCTQKPPQDVVQGIIGGRANVCSSSCGFFCCCSCYDGRDSEHKFLHIEKRLLLLFLILRGKKPKGNLGFVMTDFSSVRYTWKFLSDTNWFAPLNKNLLLEKNIALLQDDKNEKPIPHIWAWCTCFSKLCDKIKSGVLKLR